MGDVQTDLENSYYQLKENMEYDCVSFIKLYCQNLSYKLLGQDYFAYTQASLLS